MSSTWLLVALLGAGVQAQPSGPGPRVAHAAAFHAGLGLTVVFGGRDASGEDHNDLWGWDGARWHLLDDGRAGPPPRSRHAIAYDRAGDRLIVQGGGAREHDLDDTWVWAGGRWASLRGEGPGARSHHHMAWDGSSGAVWLYGGGRSQEGFGSDVWLLEGEAWMAASSPLQPGRVLAAAVGADGGVLLFGGLIRGSARTTELWRWTGDAWTLLDEGPHPTSPNAARSGPEGRIYPGLAWDEVGRELVLFGGEGEEGLLGDTWVRWGSRWHRRETDPRPSPRTEHVLVHDGSRGVSVLFGGRTREGPTDEVWEWNGHRWDRVYPPDSREPAAVREDLLGSTAGRRSAAGGAR